MDHDEFEQQYQLFGVYYSDYIISGLRLAAHDALPTGINNSCHESQATTQQVLLQHKRISHMDIV